MRWQADGAELDEATIVGVTSLAHSLCHIGELVIAGAMLAVMREFQLDRLTAPALPLLGYVLMGVGAIPVGLWADAWKPTRMLMVYFLGMAAASLAVAASSNLATLLAALTGLGLMLSIYHPTGLAMISLGVRARGRAMGINGVAGSIGVATGPALGSLAASIGMWRLAYVVVAILALCGAAVLWLAVRRAGSRSSLRAETGQRNAPSRNVVGQNSNSPDDAEQQTSSSVFLLAFLMGAMLLGGLNYRLLVTALPTYLSGESATGGQLAKAGMSIFLALVVGGVGQICGGLIADRLGARRVYGQLIALLVPSAILLGSVGGTSYVLPAACLLALCLFAQQPVENSLLAECTSARRRSTSYGTKFALTFGIGALGAPLVGLIWRETGSLGPVFYALAASAGVMALLTGLFVYFSRRGPR
jgi:MFS family permease